MRWEVEMNRLGEKKGEEESETMTLVHAVVAVTLRWLCFEAVVVQGEIVGMRVMQESLAATRSSAKLW